MAIVTIQAPALNNIQKKRIGERVIDFLHNEGVPASSVIVLFRPEDADIVLDGGLLIEARPQPSVAASPNTITTVTKPAPLTFIRDQPSPAPAPASASVSASAPTQARRALPDFEEVKEKIRKMLIDNGAISSFQAQAGLALKGIDGASALLRRAFAELEAEGMVEKQGQKRGTRYVMKGITAAQQPQAALVKLVKAADRPATDKGVIE
jgi:hypothetical protein